MKSSNLKLKLTATANDVYTNISTSRKITKENFREKYPYLDFKKLRKINAPYHQAILCELYEKKNLYSVDIFKTLIQVQNQEAELLQWPNKQKFFQDSNDAVDHIAKQLCEAEKEKNNYNYQKFIEIIFNLAKYFDADITFAWLAEQFYLLAIKECNNNDLNGKILALIKYRYAKFLNNHGLHEKVLTILDRTFLIIVEEHKWIFDFPDDRIMANEISLEMRKAILHVVKEIRNVDPEKSLKLVNFAIDFWERGTNQFQSTKDLSDFYLHKGKILLHFKEYDGAITQFELALKTAVFENLTRNICKAYLNLVRVYYLLKNYAMLSKLAQNLLEVSQKDSTLKLYEGEAYYFLGRLYFDTNLSERAVEIFEKAIEIFDQLKINKTVRDIRCFSGIALATGILSVVISETYSKEYVFKSSANDFKEIFEFPSKKTSTENVPQIFLNANLRKLSTDKKRPFRE